MTTKEPKPKPPVTQEEATAAIGTLLEPGGRIADDSSIKNGRVKLDIHKHSSVVDLGTEAVTALLPADRANPDAVRTVLEPHLERFSKLRMESRIAFARSIVDTALLDGMVQLMNTEPDSERWVEDKLTDTVQFVAFAGRQITAAAVSEPAA